MNNPKNVILTVDAILSDGKRILFVRRAKEPFMDKLVLPGGHAEPTDFTMVDACHREILEEVGIDIPRNRLQVLCKLDAPGRDPRPGNRESLVFCALVDPSVLDQARAGSDAAEIVWHNMATPLDNDAIGFGHSEAVAAYYRYLELVASFEDDDGWPGIP